MDGTKTATATRTAAPTLEAPLAHLPAVVSTMGHLQPIETLPPYLRCDTREDLTAIIQDLIEARMVPNSFFKDPKNPTQSEPDQAKMKIAIMNGRELGYPAQFSLQHQCVINGIPSWYGDVALGRVLVSGLLLDIEESFIPGELNEHGAPKNPKAVIRLLRRGIPTPIVREFSWEDAERAELTVKSGPWQQYYKRMLQFRARTFGLRDGFADILMGMRVAEEHFTREIWEKGGFTIDHDATPTPAAPPRPARPNAPPEIAAVDQVVEAEFFPAKDAFGNDVGMYPSGTWLELAQDYVERLDPGQMATWFEHNGEVLADLQTKLGQKATEWFSEIKQGLAVMARGTAPAEAKEKPPAPPEPKEGPAPAPAASPLPSAAPAAATPTPPPTAAPSAAPAPTDKPKFDLKDHTGVVKAVTGDFMKAITWVKNLHEGLPAGDALRLRVYNHAWLLEADKAGVLSPLMKATLLPPGEVKPATAPIPQTPPKAPAPPPAEPAQAAPEPPPPPPPEPAPAAPAPAAAPQATEKPAEAPAPAEPLPPQPAEAPPPTTMPAADPPADGKKKRAPKAKAEPDPADLDKRWELKVVQWQPDMATGYAYYVAMEAEIKRLIAVKAPAPAFHRLIEINQAGIAEYAKTNKSWAAMISRNAEAKAKVAPLSPESGT